MYKSVLYNITIYGFQLLYQFSIYSELINRPVIKEKLKSERQKLFNVMKEYFKALQTHSIPEIIAVPMCQQLSEVIKEIMKIRQLEKRAEDVQKTASKLLDDLSNYENFEYMLKELIDDLKHQNGKLFENWCDDVLISIKNGKLR